MAIVYRAVDPAGRQVALKLSRPLAGSDGRQRLRREIDVQTQLKHPHIMTILDHSTGDQEPWFSMPVADGTLKALGPTNEVAVRELVADLAGALQYAHTCGYLHRDISPGNLLRMNDGRWVVADWGVVRRPLGQTTQLLTTGGGWGTAGYAAPELQTASPHQATPAADVYSLGRIAARLLTGVEPQPNVPLLPSGPWRGVIAEATAALPTRRPGSMVEFVQLMDRLLEDAPTNDWERIEAALTKVNWAPHPGHEVWTSIEALVNDADLMIDVVARIDADAVRRRAQADPDASSRLALMLTSHLQDLDWGNRDFAYADVPIRWIRAAAQGLAAAGEFGLMEDVATELFTASERWDRWDQAREIARWLDRSDGAQGQALARALRRSRTGQYFSRYATASRALSPEIRRELRSG